jgi:hypothetical protein
MPEQQHWTSFKFRLEILLSVWYIKMSSPSGLVMFIVLRHDLIKVCFSMILSSLQWLLSGLIMSILGIELANRKVPSFALHRTYLIVLCTQVNL